MTEKPTEIIPPIVVPDNLDTDDSGNPAPPPPSNTPPVETPAAPETPPVETPPAETPPTDTPPVETPVETPPVDTPEEVVLDTTVWGSTGSEVGNSTLALLQDAGVDTDTAKALLYDAVQAGDITQIDAAALEAAVGKSRATLVMTGVKGYIAENNERVAETNKAVYEASGGEENWKTMIDWAKTNSVDLTEYAPLIDAGGAQARFAVSEIQARFNGDVKNTPLTANVIPRAEPSAIAAPAVQALTKAQYLPAIEAAYKSGDQRKIDQVNQARQLGRKQGL